jgi:hypothetical protein
MTQPRLTLTATVLGAPDADGAHALAAGAVLADFQPQDDVRVYFDPAGHPFCLWVAT